MNKKIILFTLALITFLDCVGGGLITPLLPTLFMNKTIGFFPISSDTVRIFYYGLSFMLFPLAIMFSSPYLGYLSDLKGRKFIMIGGMVGLILTNIFSIISIIYMNLGLFLLTRACLGIFSGSYAAASATLIDISENVNERANNIKLINLIGICGFILSPGFSLLIPKDNLSPYTLTIPFIVILCLNVINLCIVIKFLPKFKVESNHEQSIKPITKNAKTILIKKEVVMRIIKPLIFVWSNSTIAKNSITVFFYMLGYNLYFQIMSLYLHQEFHYGIAMISEFFIVMGLCYIIGMYVLHPQVNKYLSTNRAISLSLLLLMMIMLILDLNESNIFIITLLSKIWVMWLANLMFFLVSPIAAINLNNRFIGICQSQNSNNGIIMGGISQLTSISLIFGSILISFYSIFGVSILLVVSVFMLVAFLAMTMSLKDNTSLDLNTSHEA